MQAHRNHRENTAGAHGFGVQETHGILLRPENKVYAASDGLGWSSLYISTQREAPYEAKFSAVRDHLIILHLDGPVRVARALGRSQSRRLIPPGGLFILPGGMDFGVRLEGHLDSLHLYLRHHVIAEVARELGLGGHETVQLLPRLGIHDPLIEQLALSMKDALKRPDVFSRTYPDYVSRLLAAHLLRKHSSISVAPKPHSRGLTPVQMGRAVDYMQANLGAPIVLDDIAQALGLSPSHFARRFRSAAGSPPHQYLMTLRVERAKRLLIGSEPISTIATTCGFTHQEHLTRIFRRVTGITPGVFRRMASA